MAGGAVRNRHTMESNAQQFSFFAVDKFVQIDDDRFVLVCVFISAPGLHVYSHTDDTSLWLASGVKV